MLSPKLAQIIYNGFWFSPEMISSWPPSISPDFIDGTVVLSLYRAMSWRLPTSTSSLYDQTTSMDIAGGFDQTDSAGFIKINSLRLRAHNPSLGKSTRFHSFSPPTPPFPRAQPSDREFLSSCGK